MRDTQPVMLEKRIFELEKNGGGGGTADYNELTNKPQIEGITLEGNTTFEQLGVASATDLAQTDDDLQDVADDLATTMGDVASLTNSVGTVPEGETVEGQISALNNNLKRFDDFGNYDLLLQTSTSSTYTVENITNYRYLIIASYIPNNGLYNSCFIPIDLFKSINDNIFSQIKESYVTGARYVSDTSIKSLTNGNMQLYVYGVK